MRTRQTTLRSPNLAFALRSAEVGKSYPYYHQRFTLPPPSVQLSVKKLGTAGT